jgi:hypothetical protein
MSRFIFKRLVQLVVLSAALLSTKTYAGSGQGCPGVWRNSTILTCCSAGSVCCTTTGVPYCSDPGDC